MAQQQEPGTDGNVIVVSDLVKNYGSFRALNELNLTVKKGEVHGFLGPNGAGKSTTIRILLGILRKTEGTVRLLDSDPWDDAVALHRRLAYVPGDVNLWPNLSGGEAIDLFGRLRGGLDNKRRDMFLKRFELDPTKKCRTYSKGNRQKVAIVAALASNAELFILDEPTSGLDPLMEAIFQDTIRELKAQGKTVLLSSHILAEAEALCDRITIIKDGVTVNTGTLADMRQLTRTSVKVDTVKPIRGLEAVRGLVNVRVEGTHAEFGVDSEKIDEALKLLLTFDIKSLVSSPPNLEELFMSHYGSKEEVMASAEQ